MHRSPVSILRRVGFTGIRVYPFEGESPGLGHLTPRWTPWMHVSALDASGVTDCEMPPRFALPLAGMGDCL